MAVTRWTIRLANLNWVAGVLTPLVVILMEAFWVYPWFVWAGKWQALDWQRPLLSLISVVLLIGVSFILTRFFLSQRWRLRWIQLAIVACGLVTIFLVVWVEYGAGFRLLNGPWFAQIGQSFLNSFSHPQPLAVSLVAGVYLWWRGIKWGRSPYRFNSIYRSFVIGLTALVLLVLVWGASLGVVSENLLATAGIYIAGFFFFGLVALALGNLQAIHQEMLKRGETAPVFNHRWLSILLGVIGGIVIVGIAIISLLSSGLIALLAQLLNRAADWLFRILHYLVVYLSYVAGALGVVLFYAFKFILNLLTHGQPPQPLEPSDFPDMSKLQEEAALKGLPPGAILAMKWLFFAVIAAAVVFLLVKAVFRYWPSKTKGEIEEVNESLWSWDAFKADLRLFFSMIWQKFRPRRKPLGQTAPVPISYADTVISGRLDIREIYRHLLWEAACSGIARGRHETAYEYAERLGQAVPECHEQLAELTGLYIDVRYGEFKPPRGRVNRANNLWKVLQGLLRRLRGA
jgi:hypothetical protein